MEHVGESEYSFLFVEMELMVQLQVNNFAAKLGRSQAGNHVITNIEYNWQGRTEVVFSNYLYKIRQICGKVG